MDVRKLVLANGVELECAESGQGTRPLLLVHGFTGSRDDWREHMGPLAEFGRTLALDQRGHGGSMNTGVFDFTPGGKKIAEESMKVLKDIESKLT